MGYDENGKAIRKVVTAKTRAEVVKKLKAIQRQLDDGLPLPDQSMTVAQLLDRWYEDISASGGRKCRPRISERRHPPHHSYSWTKETRRAHDQ
jgi:hypothetical protein